MRLRLPVMMGIPRNRVRMTSLVAGLLVLIAACESREKNDDESTPAAHVNTAVAVRTAIATSQPFLETLGAIGTVTPRAGHVALLSAPAPTRVAQVFVSAGQHVSAGETLVILEQSTFRAAAGSAEAEVNAAERNYERSKSLSEAGIIPRKELDQATADLAKARSDLVAARRAEQLSVLRSPISGVVTRMDAMLGAAVDANQPLVEVADPRAVDIILNVTATQAPTVAPGIKVDLRAGQSASGEPLGVGTVIDIAGTVDSASRSVAVRVRAPTTRRPLRIGETVYGEITLATRANAITVPIDALVPAGDGFKVFVVDGASIAHARPITVSSRTMTVAEIAAGLSPGERVVTYGAYGLEDGAKVVAMKQ
jgi:RND family efflux transporter MFP subunit